MKLGQVRFKLGKNSEEVNKVYCDRGFLPQQGLIGVKVEKVYVGAF